MAGTHLLQLQEYLVSSFFYFFNVSNKVAFTELVIRILELDHMVVWYYELLCFMRYLFLFVFFIIFLGFWYVCLVSRVAGKRTDVLTILQNCAVLSIADM